MLDGVKRSDDGQASMTKTLNAWDRPELAEYYGTMAGSHLVGHARLNIIGWQVKKADVSRTDTGTRVDLWLGGDRFDSSRYSFPRGN